MKIKKLNLGCGDDYREGYINVDFDNTVKADKYFDLRETFPLENESFDEVLAQDVLEHFTKENADLFIKEIRRILKPEGILRLRVPNVYQIFDQFYADSPTMMKFIYGDTSKGELGAHKNGFTKKSLKMILSINNFYNIKIEEVETNFVVSANKTSKYDKSKNILFSLQDSGGLGGAENFIISLGTELSKTRKVSYLIVNKNKGLKRLLQKNNLYFTKERMDIIGGLRGFFKFFIYLIPELIEFWKIIRDFKEDNGKYIFLSGISDKIMITPIARFQNIKVFWIEFAPLESVLNRNFYIPLILYKIMASLTSKIIVPSRNTRRALIDQQSISDAQIEIIHCGINPIKKIYSKYKHNSDFVIGLISRLEIGKGQDTLIEISNLLKDKIPNLKVSIIGEGYDLSRLKSMVTKYKLEKIVQFHGYLKDPYSLLSKFDIFVFPSRWNLEGFGLVNLEAMELSVPIVTSNLGPIPEVVGNSGVMCEDKPENYAKEILNLYRDKDKRINLVKLGKNRVKEFYISEIAKQYENICNIADSQ